MPYAKHLVCAVQALLCAVGMFNARAETLISSNAVWRFAKGTAEVSAPAVGWRAPEFDASAWTTASAPFHYGEAGLTGGTRLADMQNAYNCVFLRREFTVSNAAEVGAVTLLAASDDGFVAWLNGSEIARYRVDAGEVRFDSLANSSAPEPVRFEAYPVTNVSGLLREGTNLLAVQAFNRARDNGDFQINVALNAARLDPTPPTLAAVSPAPGTVGALSQILVTFSEAVTGVDAEDLLLNGVPARRVSGGGAEYTFTFDSPRLGLAQLAWSGTHGITDFGATPNPFDSTAASARWEYTVVDGLPPGVVQVHPPAGARLRELTRVEVLFSEPVAGLDAADLLVNGQPATNVQGLLAGPYVFEFAPAADGAAVLAWAGEHGIQDLAAPANAFAGGAWDYFVDSAAPTGAVAITEFCASNLTGLKDEDGDAEDWIELHNPGAAAVNLAGWSLTDDAESPGKWVFPAVTIPPGGFLLVFGSGKDRRATEVGARLHTSFKLGADDEYLALFDAHSPRRVVSEFAPHYPTQRNDFSYGVAADGAWRYFRVPTPGALNGASEIATALSKVHFTSGRALCEVPFDLALTNADPAAVIRYTLDGSEPTEAAGAVYAGPLRIENSVTVRAAAFKSDALPSRVATHTYLFPEQVLRQPATPAGFPTNWGSAKITVGDYAMDARVVDAPAYSARVRAGLRSLPALSLVMPMGDWFSPQRGIYSNGQLEGMAWERAVSAEWINPDGRDGFQLDCGVRIQGGTSPQPWKSYKLSLRLNFRSDYGPSRLDERLFPDTPVTSFDTLVLDAGLNYVWHYGGGSSPDEQRRRAKYVQDQFVSDLQNAAGTPSFHGRWVNLFLNGAYWGIYNVHEDPHAAFAADYLGGVESEYDVLKHTGSTVQDGNAVAWQAMKTLARRGPADPAVYAALAELVDLPALADYMLLNFYVGNTDWPQHNWYAIRRRVPGGRWTFHNWDAEHVLKNVTDDRTGVSDADSPAELYALLRQNAEFRLLFADRAHRHFFNGGILYVDPQHAVPDVAHPEWNRPADFFFRRLAQIETALVAESARWGDNQRPAQPYTVDVELKAELDWLRAVYFPQRSATVLNQLRAIGLYPRIVAPAFSQLGGYVPAGFALNVSAPAGEVFYTLDGSDPRLAGSGGVSASAVKFDGTALMLISEVVVKARARVGVEWSALTEATFQVARLGLPLWPTEIMYNPAGGEAYEFLELRNFSRVTLDLSGCVLEGVGFTFPPGSELAAGQVIVLASGAAPADFARRYPGVAVFGQFTGALANGGESLTLRDPQGRVIWQFAYDDSAGWPAEADGAGASLELLDAAGDLGDPATWQASAAAGGSPGAWQETAPLAAVRLNEIFASAADGTADFVELFNAGAQELPLAGWRLTDRAGRKELFLPAEASLAPGALLVIWCDGATNGVPWHAPFALDQDGDGAFLYDAQGRRVDAVSFGAQLEGFSIGRGAAGSWELNQPTPAAANLPAATAPASNLRLNEWLANSPAGEDDWIELFNASTAAPVALRGLHVATDDSLVRVGAHAFIAPGGFLRLWADGQSGGNHLALKLSAAGESLALRDTDGAPVDRVTYAAVAEDVSLGRFPDGGMELVTLAAQTPGWPNSQDPASADRDGDGLPDAWELANGLSPHLRSGDDGANGDPDLDGRTNAEEFAAGTRPRDASSQLTLAAVQTGLGTVELQWEGAPGRRYTLETTRDLVAGGWLVLSNLPPSEVGGPIHVPVEAALPEGGQFFRLGASAR